MIDVMQQFTNVECRLSLLERRQVRTRMGSPTWPPSANKVTNAGAKPVWSIGVRVAKNAPWAM